MAEKKSLIWQYFDLGSTSATCKMYQKAFKQSHGNMSNLIAHMKREHPKEFQNMQENDERWKMAADAQWGGMSFVYLNWIMWAHRHSQALCRTSTIIFFFVKNTRLYMHYAGLSVCLSVTHLWATSILFNWNAFCTIRRPVVLCPESDFCRCSHFHGCTYIYWRVISIWNWGHVNRS